MQNLLEKRLRRAAIAQAIFIYLGELGRVAQPELNNTISLCLNELTLTYLPISYRLSSRWLLQCLSMLFHGRIPFDGLHQSLSLVALLR